MFFHHWVTYFLFCTYITGTSRQIDVRQIKRWALIKACVTPPTIDKLSYFLSLTKHRIKCITGLLLVKSPNFTLMKRCQSMHLLTEILLFKLSWSRYKCLLFCEPSECAFLNKVSVQAQWISNRQSISLGHFSQALSPTLHPARCIGL